MTDSETPSRLGTLNSTATEPFEELRSAIAGGDVAKTLDHLVELLRRDRRHHELFDALLMRGRLRLGLPVVLAGSLDDLAEPLRGQVEQAYIAACREVGLALASAGQLREAWMYLRPVSDPALVAEVLEKIEPNDENLQDLIEIGVHEGMAIPLGYRLVLEKYGTCNAITMFDGVIAGRPRRDQQAAADLLVRHLHRELVANLRADIQRQEGTDPGGQSLAELVADRDWLFGEHNYHVDTTHLASVVRFARVLEDPAALRVALDLTAYGRRLHRQFQFPGEEPFKDTYPAHALLFGAMLGEDTEDALTYFRTRAEELGSEQAGTLPAEVYVALLSHLERHDEALAAAARWLPPGTRATGFAPNLMALSRRAGRFDRLIQVSQERGDLVGFAAGLVEQARQQATTAAGEATPGQGAAGATRPVDRSGAHEK